MSTLHELRLTLEQHAEGLPDTEHTARAAAIHQRVRVVRRRRTAAVAIAAVVTLIAAVAVTGLLRTQSDPVPAESWHGVDVPTEVELAAGTYELDEVQDMEPGRKLEFTYPDGMEVDRTAVALVATGLGDGTATLLVSGQPLIRLVEGQELSPTFAAMLFEAEIELDGAPADARVGLALYDGPDTLYPELVGDNELVAWASEPDESSVEVTFQAALDKVTLGPLCSTDSGEFIVTIDGEVVHSDGHCSRYYPWELEVIGTTLHGYGAAGDPVEEHTVRVERTVDEAGISLGVYVEGGGADVHGTQVAETVERFGRTWTLDEVIYQNTPDEPLSTGIATDREDRLLNFVTNAYSRVNTTSDLGEPCKTIILNTAPNLDCILLAAGDSYDITITDIDPPTGPSDEFETAILVYRPAE